MCVAKGMWACASDVSDMTDNLEAPYGICFMLPLCADQA